jgi:hypothetical protein
MATFHEEGVMEGSIAPNTGIHPFSCVCDEGHCFISIFG